MVVFTDVSDDLVAAVPDGLEGIVYVALVSDNTATTIDNHLLSSYVFLDFTFSSVSFGVFGFILVLMMVLRPQGLIPERRRKMEFVELAGTEEATYEARA